jgi:thiol-disulfide isomerase/thioredoxin
MMQGRMMKKGSPMHYHREGKTLFQIWRDLGEFRLAGSVQPQSKTHRKEQTMNLFSTYQSALTYHDFLAKYGSDEHRRRWADFHARVALTAAQKELLASFKRELNVLVMAGAWCGDCVQQCPIFEHFAASAPAIKVRYIDRDADDSVKAALSIMGGARVPMVVFFSEEGNEAARFGDRTISKYRQLAKDQLGPSCPTGLVAPPAELISAVTQDWLDIFERVQWMLRLSPRLREKHGD